MPNSKNPLVPTGLFATPKNMKEMQDYLALFKGNDAIITMTCAFMAWNLASKIIDEQIIEDTNKIFI